MPQKVKEQIGIKVEKERDLPTLDGDNTVVIRTLRDGLEVVEEDHVSVVVWKEVGPGMYTSHDTELASLCTDGSDKAVRGLRFFIICTI